MFKYRSNLQVEFTRLVRMGIRAASLKCQTNNIKQNVDKREGDLKAYTNKAQTEMPLITEV